MDKRALNSGDCYKVGPALIACDYEVEILNDGPSPFGGPITFTDAIPATATLSVFPAPWVCLGGPPIACGTVGAVAIPVGGSIAVPVTVTTPLAPLEAAGCGMPNTATITVPVGTNENFFAGDDADTATADAFLFWELPGGALLVTCDPTNLKTTKVAKGDCVASEGGYRCDYVVTVTNMGKDPHHGPIELDEQFSFLPSSVKFSPEWSCPKVGGASTAGSTMSTSRRARASSQGVGHGSGWPALQAQEHRPHDGARGQHQVQRRTGRRHRVGDGQHPVERLQKARPAAMRAQDQRDPQRERRLRLQVGAVRNDNGICVGLTEPPVTEPPVAEPPVTEPKLCPDGKPVPKSGHCPSTPPQPQCGPNEERNTKGQCVCLKGFQRDQKGRCVEEETPIEEANPEDECEAKGWRWDDKRDSCVPPTTEPEEPAEPAEPSGPTGPIACKPGKNEVRNAQGQCVCKMGYERDKNGRCVAPVPQCTPGPNEERNTQGECVCKKGYDRDKNGRCVAPTPQCTPGPNEERNTQGQCVCKKGYDRDKNGRCVAPINPERECKEKGGSWDGKRCLTPAEACKAKGWAWNDKRKTCSPPTSPADECKDKGWIWNGKRQTCSPPTNPADECKQKGWVWDEKRKSCSPPPNPADECKQKGWVWDGKNCQNPADLCKAKGGGGGWKKPPAQTRPGRAVPREEGGCGTAKTARASADLCKAKGWNWNGKSRTCLPPAASTVPR